MTKVTFGEQLRAGETKAVDNPQKQKHLRHLMVDSLLDMSQNRKEVKIVQVQILPS